MFHLLNVISVLEVHLTESIWKYNYFREEKGKKLKKTIKNLLSDVIAYKKSNLPVFWVMTGVRLYEEKGRRV